VDFNPFLSFDLSPFVLELLLHLSPHLNRLFLQLPHPHFGRFLELIQTVASLNNGSLLHEELELSVGRRGLEAAIIFLNVNCCKHGALWALVLLAGIHNGIPHLLLVDDAREEVLFTELLELLVTEVEHSQTVNVGEGHIELPNIAL
jgi:hypothetical protein